MKKHLMISLLATGFTLVATGALHASSASASSSPVQASANSNACAIAQASQTPPSSPDADVKSRAAAAASPSSSKRAPMSPLAARVQEVVPKIPNELCGILAGYAKPTAIVFRNDLSVKDSRVIASAEGMPTTNDQMEPLTVQFPGMVKQVFPGTEIDLAPELETHQIFLRDKSHAKFTVQFLDKKTWRIATKIYAVTVDHMWTGIGFKLVKDEKTGQISLYEFDPATEIRPITFKLPLD